MGVTQSGYVINDEHTWVHSAPYAQLPPFAVIGGHDCDGSPIYVGRAYHEGDNLPAKVVPSKGAAYVAWGGAEHTKSHYEILVGQSYAWIPCYGGSVPPNAVRSGNTRNGEPLYVGRGHHANSLTVGKIHPSHGCLYIPFGGQEIRINTYEVLVWECRENWVASTPNYTPPGAVVAGHDTDHATIYVGRAMHEAYKWVHSSVQTSIPPQAVVGGNDVDGDIMYVGRSFHNGDMLVTKIIPSKHAAFVSWHGQEISKDAFEVLCGQSLVWRHCYDHVIPENAVLCGKTALGQHVYIGRGHFEGSLTVGKVSSVHRALFIPFGGIERRLESYEILVEETRDPGWSIPPSSEKHYPVDDIKPILPISVKPPPYSQMPQPTPFVPCGTAPPYSAGPVVCPIPTPPPPPPPYEASPAVYPPRHSGPYDTWVNASPTYTPPNAVHAGHDTDMSTILVCRAFNNGDLIPGKAIPGRGCAYISKSGQEVAVTSYEILIGDNYQWVHSHGGIVPPGAVEGGRTSSGEPLYVGRAQFCGSLTPGKVQRSHQCLYIAFGGREQRITNYEVLVRRNDYYRGQNMKLHY